MSDVWADQFSCIVWNPETGKSESVTLGTNFENETKSANSTMDASPELQALYKAECDARDERERLAADAQWKLELEESAKERLLAVRKGAEAVVTKGRKVAKGTRGTIFWTGPGNYGARVGLKDADGVTHWTAESNITVVLPGTDPGFVPTGGWAALGDKVTLAEGEWLKSLPRKGAKVRVLESGDELTVFWQKDDRLGLKKNPRSRTEDPVWVNASEVAVLTDSGEVTPSKSPDLDAVVAEAIAPVLAELPAPFCDIRSIEQRGDDDFAALDANGNFLVALPAESAVQIQALLEA